jgi:uncharacterized iron-regulated membrane protein
MTTANQRLRRIWLQVHKWIGLGLAVLIIPICLSGSALVWHDWLDETLHPGRYAVSGAAAALPPSAHLAAARTVIGSGERIASLRYAEGAGPVTVTATRPATGGGRPPRTNVWIDPGTARILDEADGNAGPVRFLHVLHGSLMVPGLGRQIVGWVGVFMGLSCLTGLWLWWPLGGSLRRGFRWKRQNSTSANLHHQMGFWVLVPLFMLSFTGAWISFPGFFGRFEAQPPRAGGGGGGGPATPLAALSLGIDDAVAAARVHGTGRLVSIALPDDRAGTGRVAFARGEGIAEVEVDDASGAVKPPVPPRPETRARTMRRWHDGTGMGAVWQVVIFIGGLIPAALAVTGVIMWLRSRGWRSRLDRRRRAGAPVPQPAP